MTTRELFCIHKKILYGESNVFLTLLGLFHRAILIAGSSHSSWALIQETFVAGQNVAGALNCSTQNNSFGGDHNLGVLPITTTTANPHGHVSDPVFEIETFF